MVGMLFIIEESFAREVKDRRALRTQRRIITFEDINVGKYILLLHDVHWAVVLLGSLLTILAVSGGRKVNAVLLPVYFIIIVYLTIMCRELGLGRIKLSPFWSYKQFFSQHKLRMEILNNIWLFIPLGAILYKLIPKWYVVFVLIMISMIIEVSQYLLDVGLCESDDVISNGLGGAIGILICYGINSLKEKRRREPH